LALLQPWISRQASAVEREVPNPPADNTLSFIYI
jgi:hypothetical protein